ncbi:hypothetical protein Cgig2_032721 [Carnegiea gigantea]|uniref:POTRA domain-containing protein n=1 Tax=Carnegiea gigantea TaxID=171969 RepID=A0A9Q1KJL8_9CARY|nr:hypothetical protein Cgig2_032721 [Carnegiea gigantea]
MGGTASKRRMSGVSSAKKQRSCNPKLDMQRVAVRVHDVIIKGNTRTKDLVIRAAMDDLLRASTLGEVSQGVQVAGDRLHQLGIFDDIQLGFQDGPTDLPDTVNALVSVKELPLKKLCDGKVGFAINRGGTCPNVQGELKWKNLLGLADTWEGSVSYNKVDNAGEFSTKVSLPKLGDCVGPVSARTYLGSQDFLKSSSYKQHALGLALDLLNTKNHKLSYDLAWRTLTTDRSQTASKSVSRQLGHDLLSSAKYSYQVDQRDSIKRPTKGYAYSLITQLAGLFPDLRSTRFLRQQFDFRCALPLKWFGKANAALNLGMSGGVVIPSGKKLSIADKIFMGGDSFSPIGSIGELGSFPGFEYRGLGPSEKRRNTLLRDALGGDVALSTFANISYDLPMKALRDAGIYGHAFACAGNLSNIHDNGGHNFSPKKFLQTFRTSIGCGVVIPPNKVIPFATEIVSKAFQT